MRLLFSKMQYKVGFCRVLFSKITWVKVSVTHSRSLSVGKFLSLNQSMIEIGVRINAINWITWIGVVAKFG